MKLKIGFVLFAAIALFLMACNSESPENTDVSDQELVCTLTEDEKIERKVLLTSLLGDQLIKKKAKFNGMTFFFENNADVLDNLTEVVKLESECCSFFTFDIRVKSNQKGIEFGINGPPGSSLFLENFLN